MMASLDEIYKNYESNIDNSVDKRNYRSAVVDTDSTKFGSEKEINSDVKLNTKDEVKVNICVNKSKNI